MASNFLAIMCSKSSTGSRRPLGALAWLPRRVPVRLRTPPSSVPVYRRIEAVTLANLSIQERKRTRVPQTAPTAILEQVEKAQEN
jgi:hypothetical protein